MKTDIDRSLAFTALLEFPEFRQTESKEGSRIISLFLADWYESGETDMWKYSQKWARGYFSS